MRRVVLDEIGQAIRRLEVRFPGRRVRHIAFHVALPAKPPRRLFEEVDDSALRKQRRPVIVGDVAQLPGN